MNLNVLKYVVTVSQEKNFTRAAQKLYVAQPSLSQSIHSLEEQLGVQLFDRSRNPIELTPAGELYVEWAQVMLRSEEKMLAKLQNTSGNTRRRITIGASPYRSKSIFPDAVKTFYDRVDNCTVVLQEKPYKELISMLDSGDIDMLVDMPQSDTLQYTNIHIAEERFFVAADEHYKFDIFKNGDYPSIRFSDIIDKPFILIDETMYLGTIIRSIFTQFDEVPNTIMVCPSAETANIMVGTGIGISLIPELYINNTRRYSNINYYLLDDLKLSREIAVVYRNDRYLTDDCRILLEILQEEYAKLTCL